MIKELLLLPPKIGVQSAVWMGSLTLAGARLGIDAASAAQESARRLLDSREHCRHLMKNHVYLEKRQIEAEIIERKDDFKLVDLNAQRWVHLSQRHAERVAEGSEPASQDYIEQIRDIMVRGGLAQTTIDVAVAKLQETAAMPVDLDQFSAHGLAERKV